MLTWDCFHSRCSEGNNYQNHVNVDDYLTIVHCTVPRDHLKLPRLSQTLSATVSCNGRQACQWKLSESLISELVILSQTLKNIEPAEDIFDYDMCEVKAALSYLFLFLNEPKAKRTL